MDRKGHKTVIRYMGIWIVTAAIFTMAVFGVAWKDEREKQIKIAKVFEEYPELETDLAGIYFKGIVEEEKDRLNRAAAVFEEKYGYDFYGQVFHHVVWYLWIFLLFLETGAVCLVYFREKRRIMPDSDIVLRQMNEILEQLERFRRGEFFLSVSNGTAMDKELTAEVGKNSDYWNVSQSVKEALREVGLYFEVLKERLELEENSTKALITDISHQLKTPIASLRISYELLLTEDLTKQEKDEFLLRGEQEIRKLEVLLEELVKLSRLEFSMIQLNPENADMNRTLTEALNRVYMKAHEKQIEISLEKEPPFLQDAVLVHHDVKWTGEALANVLDNAVKYSNPNTHITVRMSRISMNLLIEIEDEGIGIPAGELHKIYQRFYRGEEAKKMVSDGAGVGLYLARNILEKQGGTITAKRRQRKGTVFRISMPLIRN